MKHLDKPATVAEEEAEAEFIKAMQQCIAKDIPTPWAPPKDEGDIAGATVAGPHT